jgi:SPP1 gp7 family putative phage head morphogenesis protein
MSDEKLTTIYSQHTIHVQRVGATEGLKVIPYLESIENDVVSILNKYRKRRVTIDLQVKIQDEIDTATRKHLQDYTSQLKVENRELGTYEGEFAASTLNGLVENDEFKAVAPTAAAVNSIAIITPVKLSDNSYSSYSSMMRNYWGKWSDEVHGVVLDGFRKGQTIPEITNAITAQMDLSKSGTTKSVLDRARRSAKQLAITGTNHYANTARIAFVDKNDDILKGYRFLAVNDSRTSRTCARLDQTTYAKDDPKLSSVTPPLHPNCVLGDTLITSAFGVSSISKRRHKGVFVTITSANGDAITVTPNHPVLTATGWLPAKSINRFDKIVNQCRVKEVGVVDGHNNGIIPSISKVFDSVRCSSQVSTSEVPLSTPDFHNDASDGEVAVILTDSGLGVIDDSLAIKYSGELKLKGRNKRSGLFSRLSSFDKFGFRCFSSGNRFVSCASKSLSFLIRCIIHPRLLLLTSISDVNAIFGKNSLHWTRRDTDGLSDSCNTYAGGVSFDDVVNVSFAEFDSHVYNLETVDHCYAANGIITHNCRSALTFDVDDRFKLDASDTKKASSFEVDGKRKGKPVDSDSIYYENLKKLGERKDGWKDIDAVIGPTLGKALRKMDAREFAKMTGDSMNNPLTITQMKANNNELGRILRSQ